MVGDYVMSQKHQSVYIGACPVHHEDKSVEGNYVEMLGETFYRIENYDRMPPFFMSIVSSTDHWLFISSTGGLSAGRVNAEAALFPYYTEDKLSENSENTGSKTVLLIDRQECRYLWEPFSASYGGLYRLKRNLYKNISGDTLVFEEINHDLKLRFRYAWRSSDRYGLVRTAWLKNDDVESCPVSLVDGLQNLLPYGVTTTLQNNMSNLLNAYKRNELEPQTGLGIFALSATLTDLAEPSESLKATTVWQIGLKRVCYLLSSEQLEAFRQGLAIRPESDIRGKRGAYLLNADFALAPGEEKEWSLVAEVNQGSSDIAALLRELKTDKSILKQSLLSDIKQGRDNLLDIVASSDGLQNSADRLDAAHHFANVLFNVMRGGNFADNYTIDKADLLDFVRVRNPGVLELVASFFAELSTQVNVADLLTRAAETAVADIERLCYEYLPLSFSRRHGDPSRPWNRFSINLKNPDGSQRLDYQGNWRDIFQNWEALAYSYPEFVETMICKFLNATTADGYNPYRVTRAGIEWEVPEPDNPWANIGYWSDHQIIYLQKLLEVSARFHPGKLQSLLARRIFSYANVPYRIKPYTSLLKDCYNTIDFDAELDKQITAKVALLGTDAKLLPDASAKVLHVNLTEKLLSLLLAKLVNFVPEGGIWMNTQRPEWNDANNALVGKGLSVVTVCYLRRFIAFCRDLFAKTSGSVPITWELKTLFDKVHATLLEHQAALQTTFGDEQRRAVMDALGIAASNYRWHCYEKGLSGELAELNKDALLALLDIALHYVEHTLSANQREDGLYHAYNILQLDGKKASVSHLFAMLEGQVAILSAGILSADESLTLLKSLRNSPMYRADQHSYMLYPDRDLAGFLQKNTIPSAKVQNSALLLALLKRNDRSVISRDVSGAYHFNGEFRNAKDVKRALLQLPQDAQLVKLVEAEADVVLQLFDEVFDHQSFTGRSGTFFAYEGLGSIYWHMVSKLLLAVQETYWRASDAGVTPTTLSALTETYYDIRQGLGFNKTPDVYGAFPTDPYSHTPAGQGAKQPGMTGQVKEEILTRLGEMGAWVEQGRLSFKPLLLREREFKQQPGVFSYIDVAGKKQKLDLPKDSLAFTFCQLPVVYRAAEQEKIVIQLADGDSQEGMGSSMNEEFSQHVFRRDGVIRQLTVYTKAGCA